MHLRLPSGRVLGALAAPCVLAGALTTAGPAGPAAAASCTPAQQAISRVISHQLPARSGAPATGLAITAPGGQPPGREPTQ